MPLRQAAVQGVRHDHEGGQVLVNDMPRDKPGTQIDPDAAIRLRGERPRFVSRGGLKLEAALDAWKEGA